MMSPSEDRDDLYSSKVAKKSKTNNLQLAMTVTAEEEDATEPHPVAYRGRVRDQLDCH
jgi:hypothetical protein